VAGRPCFLVSVWRRGRRAVRRRRLCWCCRWRLWCIIYLEQWRRGRAESAANSPSSGVPPTAETAGRSAKRRPSAKRVAVQAPAAPPASVGAGLGAQTAPPRPRRAPPLRPAPPLAPAPHLASGLLEEVGDASYEAQTGEDRIHALRVCTEIDTYERDDSGVVQRRNRSLCIAPVVQLHRKLKVRLLPKAENGGKRGFFLLAQGLRQHPNVELVGSNAFFCDDTGYDLQDGSKCEADVRTLGEPAALADVGIMMAPATDLLGYSNKNGLLGFSPYRWGNVNARPLAMSPVRNVGSVKGYEDIRSMDENPTLFRYALPVPRDRMIIVDETDAPASHGAVDDADANYLAYFKRSWMHKRDSHPLRAHGSRHKSGGYFPMPYAIADQYFDSANLGHVSQARPQKTTKYHKIPLGPADSRRLHAPRHRRRARTHAPLAACLGLERGRDAGVGSVGASAAGVDTTALGMAAVWAAVWMATASLLDAD